MNNTSKRHTEQRFISLLTTDDSWWCRDSRDETFQKLQSVLAAKDLELAQAQQSYSVLQSELLELRRIKQREGVNMDYLKNIVVQVSLECMLKI